MYNSTVDNNEIPIGSFNGEIYRSDHPSNTVIGSVCLYFREGLSTKRHIDSLLILQNFNTARKSDNIILTYLKAFFVRHSSEYENVQ